MIGAPVRIPRERLTPEALRGLVEAFVLREGTDYGHRDYSLDEKCAAVLRQLDAGEVDIWFDPATGSAELLAREAGHGADPGRRSGRPPNS